MWTVPASSAAAQLEGAQTAFAVDDEKPHVGEMLPTSRHASPLEH